MKQLALLSLCGLALLSCGGPMATPEAKPSWSLPRDASTADRAWWSWLTGHGEALRRTYLNPEPRRIETGDPGWSLGPGNVTVSLPPFPEDATVPEAPALRTTVADLMLLRLLMARLTQERLDPANTLVAATLAYHGLSGGTPASRLAWLWAERASTEVPDGEAILNRYLGQHSARPSAPVSARHTIRLSFLPFLDARRLIARPPVLQDSGTLIALNQTWALTETQPKPDAEALLASVYTLPPGPAHLEIASPGRLLAFRDGRLVLATPTDRTTVDTVRFTAAGAGPLILVWSSSSVPKPRTWPQAFVEAPGPVSCASARGASSPTKAMISALLALEDGDREGVERWLIGAPSSVVVDLLRAQAMAADPSVPAGRSRDARRAALNAALPALPALARLELARLARQGGDLDAAHAHLEALATSRDARVPREAFQVHFALGWNEEAEVDLDRALALAPRPCDLLDDRLALMGARGDTRGRLRLVEALVGCGRGREAAETLLELDRPAEALSQLDALPGAALDSKALRVRRRALVAQGRLEEARALAAAPSLGETDDASQALEAADLGPPALLDAALVELMRSHPNAPEVRELILARPETSFFAPLIQDTDAVITAYEADARAHPEAYAGPAIRVLDQGATIYSNDGRRLRWVHEILAISTREAAENFGEVNLPAGAAAVAVFNRKADGRRLYAEDQPEKDSLSVPDLAIGDYIVAIYLEPGDNGYLYPTGFLTPRIMLQSHQLPVFRQLAAVFSPDEQPPEAQRLAGAAAPTPVRLTSMGRAGLQFEVTRAPALPPEDDAAPAALTLPSVRLGRNVELRADLDFTRDRVLGRRQRNAAFDAWALDTAGEGDPLERAARLNRAVRERVDGQTGLIADDAPRMWESGHGHRALVLSAALETAGVPHRLLLSRPKVHVPAGPFEQIADFPYALIALAPDFQTIIDPGPSRAPVGFLPFGFLGGDAVVVWPADGPPTPVALPKTRKIEDGRQVHLRLQWAADGTLTGEVEDVLRGQEAIVIGEYLARLDPTARPKVAERMILPVVGASTVTRFDDPTTAVAEIALDARYEGDLVLRYAFKTQADETLEIGLFPVNPGRAWAGRASRATPLLLDLPTHQGVTVELESERRLESLSPPDAQATGAGVRFYRRTLAGWADSWRIESRLDIDGGLIPPEEYGAFGETARAVDPLESAGFRVISGPR